MSNESLHKLINSGVLLCYKLENVSEEGEVGVHSKFRNTERLTLYFPSGDSLIIDTFCSGCFEDTCLIIKGDSK
jgi:hypothetical protein